MRKPQIKMLKTRAKNARFRAAKAKARSEAALSEKTLIEKRAKAYSDMESHVGDLVSMGKIAMELFDKDKGLFVFAVGKLEDAVVMRNDHGRALVLVRQLDDQVHHLPTALGVERRRRLVGQKERR
jgi:hypothetical protein